MVDTSDPPQCQSHRYVGQVWPGGPHAIFRSLWEGYRVLLVDPAGTTLHELPALPVPAPAGVPRLAVASWDLHAEYNPTRMQILRWTDSGPVLEWDFEPGGGRTAAWGPRHPVWLAADPVRFDRMDVEERIQGQVELVRRNGSWTVLRGTLD